MEDEEQSLLDLIKANKGTGKGITKEIMGGATDALGSVTGHVGTVMGIVKDLGKSKRDRMNDDGVVTHDTDYMGNITGMAAAGGDIGKMLGPVGQLVGSLAGGVAGLGVSLFDDSKNPTFGDQVARRENKAMETNIQNLGAEDTFSKQQLMAENGLDVQGGAKPVEVERDEVVLRKNGKAFTKVADFRGGKSHMQGGEDYMAQDGDIIIPKDKRNRVEKLLKNRRWSSIESLRRTLPTDTPGGPAPQMAKGSKGVYADGTSGISTDPGKNSNVSKSKRNAKWDKFLSQPGVYAKMEQIARDNGFSISDLMSTIDFETGGSFSPSQRTGFKVGKDGRRKRISSATGLIQFMDETAEELGTTTESLSKMNVLQQLNFVEKYYKKHHKYGDHPYDVIVGSSSGGKKDSDILYKKGSAQANANPSWVDENGNITKESARKVVAVNDDYTVPTGVISTSSQGAELLTEAQRNGEWVEPETGLTDEQRARRTRERGYEPYEDYVSRRAKEGKKPESKAWYEQNVIDPYEEEQRGYWTMDSPKGRENVRQVGVVRDDANLEPYALSLKEKDAKERRNYERFPDDPRLQNLDDKGFLDYSESMLRKIDPEMTDEEFVDKVKDASRQTVLSDMLYSGTTLFYKMFGQTDEEAIDDNYHGFRDKKLEQQALAFRKYAGDAEENGTWLGRKLTQGFNFWDRIRVTAIDGTIDSDSGGVVSTDIANLLTGEDPETVEQIIMNAKEAGIIDQKGVDYLWHVATDPEVFKNQANETIEDVDVATLIGAVPSLARGAVKNLPRAWKSLKGWKNALRTGMVDDTGKLTAKGIKYIRKSPELRMKLRAARHTKNSKIHRTLNDQIEYLFKGDTSLKGTETLDELEALANNVVDAGVSTMDWSKAAKNGVEFFSTSWKTLKKMPTKVLQKFGGMPYDELMRVEKQLTKITGKTSGQLRKMSPTEFAKTVSDVRKGKFETLQGSLKAREQAWKAYEPLRDSAAEAKKALDKIKKNPSADPAEMARAQKAYEEASVNLAEGAETIKKLERQSENAWANVDDMEQWVYHDELALDFNQLAKREQEIAEQVAKIDDIGEELQAAKQKQLSWRVDKSDASKSIKKGEKANAADNAGKSELQRVIDNKNAKYAEYQKKNLEVGRATKSVTDFENLSKNAPELFKALSKHVDLLETVKKTGKISANTYNILRKGDGIDLPALEKEIEEFYPQDIEGEEREERGGDSDGSDVPDAPEGQEGAEVVEREKVRGVSPMESVPGTFDNIEVPELNTPFDDSGEKSNLMGNISDGLSTLAKYAPAIYNLSKGMQPADKTKRNFIAPQTVDYKNMSGDMYRQIDEAMSASVANARNLSGGSQANFRANTEKAWAEKLGRVSQTNAMEAQRASQTAQSNIAQRNRAAEYNAQENSRADQMDMQSKAATERFFGQGVSDLANISARDRADKNLEKSQQIALQQIVSGLPPELVSDKMWYQAFGEHKPGYQGSQGETTRKSPGGVLGVKNEKKTTTDVIMPGESKTDTIAEKEFVPSEATNTMVQNMQTTEERRSNVLDVVGEAVEGFYGTGETDETVDPVNPVNPFVFESGTDKYNR